MKRELIHETAGNGNQESQAEKPPPRGSEQREQPAGSVAWLNRLFDVDSDQVRRFPVCCNYHVHITAPGPAARDAQVDLIQSDEAVL